MLYSFNNSYPQALPFRIKLSDGRVRTDPTTFTAEEIEDAGLVLAPPYPTATQDQVVTWTGTDWLVRDKTEEELYQEFLRTVPVTVTLRQAKLALLNRNLLTTVNGLIDSRGDEAAKIEWNYAKEVDRGSPLVNNLATALGLSEKDVCDLFIEASTL